MSGRDDLGLLALALPALPDLPVSPALPVSSGTGWTGQAMALGELLALTRDGLDEGVDAFVLDPARPEGPAVRARSTVDLHGAHIGAQVVLLFENGDPARPVVVGVLRGRRGWPLDEPPGSVELQADGQRLVVGAKEQLVLRCGKASLTLTRAGKVLIDGAYVSLRSSGVARIKGGSVQLN